MQHTIYIVRTSKFCNENARDIADDMNRRLNDSGDSSSLAMVTAELHSLYGDLIDLYGLKIEPVAVTVDP